VARSEQLGQPSVCWDIDSSILLLLNLLSAVTRLRKYISVYLLFFALVYLVASFIYTGLELEALPTPDSLPLSTLL
jgi:hypothetical protein